MNKYVIDLKPELIKCVNDKIIEILKLPNELLKLYMTKPYITENEQLILEKAGDAYHSNEYTIAITYYKKCSVLIGKKNNININNNNEKSQLDILVQYLISKCLLESSKLSDLIEGKNILSQLDDTIIQQYPMIYSLLGKFYIKLYCFKDAEQMINNGLALLNNKNNNLINCYVPITNKIIIESTNQGLAIELLKLKTQCTGWHRPDALCYMTDCHLNSIYHVSGRDIYFNSPTFKGMITVICNNINPCNISFHPECWKIKKNLLSSESKISDKIFLNSNCFTPNCEYNSISSKIKRIEIHNAQKMIKNIEIIVDKQNETRSNTPSTGATRKQKNKFNKSKICKSMSDLFSNKVNLNIPKECNNIMSNETDEMNSRLSKLIYLRQNNFNVDKDNDWRPDKEYYGNREFELKYDNMKPHPDLQNDDKTIAGLKSFMYSYFYQFISKNGPVKIDILQDKWNEATDLIGNCDKLLKNSKCLNVTEFLIQSLKFTIIDDYICTPESIPEAFALVKSNTCTTLRCLMNNTGESQLENEAEEFEKSIIANADRHELSNVIDNSSCQLTNINVNSSDSTLTHDNDKLSGSENNDEKFTIPSINKHKNNYESSCTLKINENEDKAITNGDIEHDNTLISSSINGSEYDIVAKDNTDNSTEMINSLIKQLEITRKILDEKDNQLLDIKMAMLKTNLDMQYVSVKLFIDNQLKACQNEYNQIDRIQNILMKIVGAQLPLHQSEWTEPIAKLEKINKTFLEQYYKKLSDVNSREYCKDIDTVCLTMPNFPMLPDRDIPGLLQIAFDMCCNHYQHSRIISPPIAPNPYTPIILPNPSMYHPQYRSNYGLHSNFIVPQPPPSPFIPQFIPQLIPRATPHYSANANTVIPQFSTNSMPQVPLPQVSTINETKKTFDESNVSVKSVESLESHSNVVNSEFDKAQATSTTIDKINESISESNETIELIENTRASIDTLMVLLRSRNKGVLEYDLLWSVCQVRKRHNNSLTGLPLSMIVKETEELLSDREKLQLDNYSTNTLRDVLRDSIKKPERKTSVSSISSHISVSSSNKELTRKKNPWNIINNSPSSSQSVDYEEDECVICIQTLNTNADSKKQIYKLECGHTFHKKCIKYWLEIDKTCPTCRKYVKMNSEFPPLIPP